MKGEGAHGEGWVALALLPEEVHGSNAVATFHLSRLESVLTELQAKEHVDSELAKASAWICFAATDSLLALCVYRAPASHVLECFC